LFFGTLGQSLQAMQCHQLDESEGEYFPITHRAFKERSDAMLEHFEKAKAEAKRQLNGRAIGGCGSQYRHTAAIDLDLAQVQVVS
jgi:hypothetical protein